MRRQLERTGRYLRGESLDSTVRGSLWTLFMVVGGLLALVSAFDLLSGTFAYPRVYGTYGCLAASLSLFAGGLAQFLPAWQRVSIVLLRAIQLVLAVVAMVFAGLYLFDLLDFVLQ